MEIHFEHLKSRRPEDVDGLPTAASQSRLASLKATNRCFRQRDCPFNATAIFPVLNLLSYNKTQGFCGRGWESILGGSLMTTTAVSFTRDHCNLGNRITIFEPLLTLHSTPDSSRHTNSSWC
jgi:hypothetical protein